MPISVAVASVIYMLAIVNTYALIISVNLRRPASQRSSPLVTIVLALLWPVMAVRIGYVYLTTKE